MKRTKSVDPIFFLVAALILSLVQIEPILAKNKGSSPAATALGWGLESGRATEADIEALVADQLMIKRNMSLVERIVRDKLSVERYYSLLGAETNLKFNPTQLEMINFANNWWNKEILGVIKRIAKNPAASCAEANQAFRLILGHERQNALLGSLYTDTGLLLEVFGDVRQRCHEEALDECNLTGRYDHFKQLVADEEHSFAVLGLGEMSPWVGEALKECANYELHYVSTTQVDDAFKLNSVIDGRIKIKPIIEGDTNLKILLNLKFEGETNSAVNPFLQKLDCSLKLTTMICSPGGSPAKTAWASIDKLEIKSKEFYTENERVLTRPVGKDNLAFTFSPAMISGKAVVRERGMEVPIPFLEVGATGFYIAHQKNQVSDQKYKFTETRKNGYPILFQFTATGQGNVESINASDSTVFQLIHKPEKKPFDAKPTTVRKPLTPKTNLDR